MLAQQIIRYSSAIMLRLHGFMTQIFKFNIGTFAKTGNIYIETI